MGCLTFYPWEYLKDEYQHTPLIQHLLENNLTAEIEETWIITLVISDGREMTYQSSFWSLYKGTVEDALAMFAGRV